MNDLDFQIRIVENRNERRRTSRIHVADHWNYISSCSRPQSFGIKAMSMLLLLVTTTSEECLTF